ncbi:MAG: HPF/RaiA family ribosome-associated protein [Lachnospiraceae bacterium]|nr:HPF/RaiA family ribosome-associated protein [Lachnospiraceae bacterium]
MINILTRNVEKTAALENVVKDRLEKLDKYNLDRINVTIKASSKMQSVELTTNYNGKLLRVEEYGKHGVTVYQLLGDVVRTLEKKIIKEKSRIDKTQSIKTMGIDAEAEHVMEVIRVKEYERKPMTVEEAMIQLEELGHPFFLYENGDTGKVEVLYKRNDDGYGVIRLK